MRSDLHVGHSIQLGPPPSQPSPQEVQQAEDAAWRNIKKVFVAAAGLYARESWLETSTPLDRHADLSRITTVPWALNSLQQVLPGGK